MLQTLSNLEYRKQAGRFPGQSRNQPLPQLPEAPVQSKLDVFFSSQILHQLFQRLDIRDDIVNLCICETIGWHQLILKASHNFRLWRFYGFMDVRFVGRNYTTIRQRHFMPKQAKPCWADPRRAGDRVTSCAAVCHYQSLTTSFRSGGSLL